MSPLQKPSTHHLQELLRGLTQYLFHGRYWLGPKEIGLGQILEDYSAYQTALLLSFTASTAMDTSTKPATACLVQYFMSNNMCILLIFTNIYQADRACRQSLELKRHQGKTLNMHTSGTCRKSQTTASASSVFSSFLVVFFIIVVAFGGSKL